MGTTAVPVAVRLNPLWWPTPHPGSATEPPKERTPMTDLQALIADVTDRLETFTTTQPTPSKMQVFLHRGAQPVPTGDGRRVVTEWPPAARWLTFPGKVTPSAVGGSLGPMLPPDGVNDPIYFTVVAVDGNRVGLAYGDYKLVAA